MAADGISTLGLPKTVISFLEDQATSKMGSFKYEIFHSEGKAELKLTWATAPNFNNKRSLVQKPKNKPPSQQRRNAERAMNWRNSEHRCTKTTTKTQTGEQKMTSVSIQTEISNYDRGMCTRSTKRNISKLSPDIEQSRSGSLIENDILDISVDALDLSITQDDFGPMMDDRSEKSKHEYPIFDETEKQESEDVMDSGVCAGLVDLSSNNQATAHDTDVLPVSTSPSSTQCSTQGIISLDSSEVDQIMDALNRLGAKIDNYSESYTS